MALIAAMLPVWLVIGVWLGGHPGDLPSFLRGTFEANHQTEVTAEALNDISRSYFRPISKTALASASIAGAVASLEDPFSHYLTASDFHTFLAPSHFSGIGVEVAPHPLGLEIVRVFDPSPAERAGLKLGQTIVAVNGRRLKGLSEEASRNLIVGPAGTTVKLTLQQGVARHTVGIVRQVVAAPEVASELRTVDHAKLAVVALASFTAGVSSEVRKAVDKALAAGARGIVFDLRHNGGGLVNEGRLVASIFIDKGLIVTMRSRTLPTQTLMAAGGAIPASVPMAVLVDRDTASAAEIVTGALQDDHRATVVGTHTFGKGVFQELQPLANGGALDITVGEYFTPNGHNLGGGGVKEGAGIAPEVPVSPQQVDTTRGLEIALDTVAKKLK
jgi:carboxyl-terminal processing protease